MNFSAIKTPPFLIERLKLDNLLEKEMSWGSTDGQDVIIGLGQRPKSLPPKYFYDKHGSELFEAICELPEYYVTRTETAIFEKYASEIVEYTGACELVELGSGSSTKTRILLDAYLEANLPLRYLPVDVSDAMLIETAHQLLKDYPELTIHGLVSTYDLVLKQLPQSELATRMLCFIGSTIGNLQPNDCQQFLGQVSQSLEPGQFFLLGLDLQKDTTVLEAAYNDKQGVTAAFNLNMLRHLNWRYDADFDLQNFVHVAFYNDEQHQMELYLESLQEQTINLKQLGLTVQFAQNERLLSEISRKFSLTQMTEKLAQQKLHVVKTFTDDQHWFGLILCQKR